MATHNVADGSGGLDASIRLEEQRDEVHLLNQSYGIFADSVPRMSAMDSEYVLLYHCLLQSLFLMYVLSALIHVLS